MLKCFHNIKFSPFFCFFFGHWTKNLTFVALFHKKTSMKRFILFAFFVFTLIAASAQHIKVTSFEHDPSDLTARTHGTSVADQNGVQCALIKIKTTDKGRWYFDVGMLGVRKTELQNERHPAEIWVYVPFGVVRLSIQHDEFGSLDKWPFPCDIEKGCTYVMQLDTEKPDPDDKDKGEEVRQQYLAFQITPPGATLEVNGKIWEVDEDGVAQEYVEFGTYSYSVQALNYHTSVGKVTVDDADNTKYVPVTLLPNFGWIEVGGSGDLRDASVYVDNMLIGKAPCKSDALKSGQHTVRIVKRMYAPYSGTVVVNDNETTRVAPDLVADYAEVTLSVDADAEIWVNDERKGVRTWTGRLGRGTYKLECKQANHETTMISKEIVPEMDGQTITLPAPVPIYGSLNVESTPKLCKLYIDGKDCGTTPKSINEILIGSHDIRLTKEGYADYTETVVIEKNERKQVKATLSNGREIQFSCNVPNAQLSVDGNALGSASGSYLLTYGNHTLTATAEGYNDYSGTLNVTENSNRHSITMQAIRTIPEGAINGLFSVSASERVYFSQGNLQYRASDGKWRFAEQQYDCIGDANSYISSSYSGWIDLFGWGTSGWNNGAVCYQPWSTSTSYSDYYPGGSYKNSLTGSYANADWGVYNAISNGGNEAGLWRTLTKDEWVYVFSTRSTASGIRYAKACVNSVNGVILLPDDWSASYYTLSSTNSTGAGFTSNTISAFQWTTLEQHGAVFLPAAGSRYGTSVSYVGSDGDYWSASYNNSYYAYRVWFSGSNLNPQYSNNRDGGGRSVRLVRSAQ